MDFFRTMSILIETPLLAAMPAGLFFMLFLVSKKRLALSASIAWLVYMGYEYGMKARLLCSGECNIRIDLLVLYPALVVLSVIVLFMAVVTMSSRNSAD